MTPLERKQLRKVRAKQRKHDVQIDRVIRHSASSPIRPGQGKLDIDHLYAQAVKDMSLRIRLTDMWYAGNAQAGKRRRQLNDWELATDPAGPVDAWQEDSKHKPKTGGRRAVGKCDVDSVTKRNQLKRNGANFS